MKHENTDTLLKQTDAGPQDSPGARARAEALRMAKIYEQEVRRLITDYGTGARPSWVSADIAFAKGRAEKYRQLAQGIEA